MSVTKIDFTTFHTLRQEIPVIDVRTPAELNKDIYPEHTIFLFLVTKSAQ